MEDTKDMAAMQAKSTRWWQWAMLAVYIPFLALLLWSLGNRIGFSNPSYLAALGVLVLGMTGGVLVARHFRKQEGELTRRSQELARDRERILAEAKQHVDKY